MHGDVRGANIICSAGDDLVAENASFIDFTNSGRFLPSSNGNITFVGEYFGSRFNSHMNLPPEFYHKLAGKDEKMFLNYQFLLQNQKILEQYLRTYILFQIKSKACYYE